MTLKHYTRAVIAIFVLCALPMSGQAARSNLFSLMERIVQVGAKVGDDIPLSSIKRGLKRKPNRVLPELKKLRRALKLLDPALLKSVDKLPEQDAKLALRVFSGAKTLEKSGPDRLVRAQIINEGGGDLILAASAYGKGVAKTAYRLQLAEGVGQIRLGMVKRFATLTADKGKPFLDGWNKWIQPNWKPLVKAGLITAFLVNPDKFINAAGNLTAYAAGEFAKAGIVIAAKTVEIVPKIIATEIKKQLIGPDRWWFLIGIVTIAMILGIWLIGKVTPLGKAASTALRQVRKFFFKKKTELNKRNLRLGTRRTMPERSNRGK